jgi:hypothetical protein
VATKWAVTSEVKGDDLQILVVLVAWTWDTGKAGTLQLAGPVEFGNFSMVTHFDLLLSIQEFHQAQYQRLVLAAKGASPLSSLMFIAHLVFLMCNKLQ